MIFKPKKISGHFENRTPGQCNQNEQTTFSRNDQRLHDKQMNGTEHNHGDKPKPRHLDPSSQLNLNNINQIVSNYTFKSRLTDKAN